MRTNCLVLGLAIAAAICRAQLPVNAPVASVEQQRNDIDYSRITEYLRLTGHRDYVSSLAFRPDGTYLLSGGRDKSLLTWTLSDKSVAARQTMDGAVTCLSYSGNGQTLAVGYGETFRDGEVSPQPGQVLLKSESELSTFGRNDWFDAPKSIAISRLGNYVAMIVDVINSDVGIAAGTVDWYARELDDLFLWKPRGQQSSEPIGIKVDGRAKALAFSCTNDTLFVGTSRGTIEAIDPVALTCKLTIKSQTAAKHKGILALAVSKDGAFVASASEDHTVALWSTATGAPVISMALQEYSPVCICFSPDGRVIAIGDNRGSVHLFSAKTGQLVKNLKGHNSAITSIAFSPNGRTLASAGGRDRTIVLWRDPRIVD